MGTETQEGSAAVVKLLGFYPLLPFATGRVTVPLRDGVMRI
jgi:hypothetical protein